MGYCTAILCVQAGEMEMLPMKFAAEDRTNFM